MSGASWRAFEVIQKDCTIDGMNIVTVRAWDARNSLVETPKHVKIVNIADGGRQRAVI
jgi:hypothetical protein